MKTRSLACSLCMLFVVFGASTLLSQQTLSGKITDEEKNPISGVLVMNMKSGVQTTSSMDGTFSISGKKNDEIRFVRRNYDRVSLTFNPEKQTSIFVTMYLSAAPIEEVEIKPQLTGILAEDTKKVGDSKKVIALKNEIGTYIRQKSDPAIMRKPGDFVQPMGPGTPTTKEGYKWDVFDFFKFIEESLGPEYFAALGISRLQIYPFVMFVLNDFDKKDILRFGYCSNLDLARFQVACENKLPLFKNKKPVVPK